MEGTFKVTVTLRSVVADGDDQESLKEAIKEALLEAVENDDAGEADLEFEAEEVDLESL